MKTLQDILSIKDKIKDIANVFGFENIKICILGDESNLAFIVDRKANEKVSDNDLLLSSMLTIYLECRVSILVSSKIKSFLKEGIMANSAPLDEEENVKYLFGNANPTDIKFSDIIYDEDKESLFGLAEIGEEVFQRTTGNIINFASFWENTKLNDNQRTEQGKLNQFVSLYQNMTLKHNN